MTAKDKHWTTLCDHQATKVAEAKISTQGCGIDAEVSAQLSQVKTERSNTNMQKAREKAQDTLRKRKESQKVDR